MTGQKEVVVVSVGFEHENSSPTINFFDFDLSKEISAETGEEIEK